MGQTERLYRIEADGYRLRLPYAEPRERVMDIRHYRDLCFPRTWG